MRKTDIKKKKRKQLNSGGILALREAVCPIYSLYISEEKIEGRIVREDFDSYRVHP